MALLVGFCVSLFCNVHCCGAGVLLEYCLKVEAHLTAVKYCFLIHVHQTLAYLMEMWLIYRVTSIGEWLALLTGALRSQAVQCPNTFSSNTRSVPVENKLFSSMYKLTLGFSRIVFCLSWKQTSCVRVFKCFVDLGCKCSHLISLWICR